jgi:putative endonuclease
MYYVYILREIEKQSLYIGYTNNLERRVEQHRSSENVDLIYYESFLSENDARERERKLKLYGSAWRGLKQRLGGSLRLRA